MYCKSSKAVLGLGKLEKVNELVCRNTHGAHLA